MNIKLKNLYITEYASDDKRKYRFTKEISEDPLVSIYVSPRISKLIESSEGLDELKVGPTYIIGDKRKLVGFIRIASIEKETKTLDLHYGVHPDYRKMGYGTKILTEVSDYLLKNNYHDVKHIKLLISNINEGSSFCARDANFKLSNIIKEKNYGNILVYTKSK